MSNFDEADTSPLESVKQNSLADWDPNIPAVKVQKGHTNKSAYAWFKVGSVHGQKVHQS